MGNFEANLINISHSLTCFAISKMKLFSIELTIALLLGASLNCNAATNLRHVSRPSSRFPQSSETPVDEDISENEDEEGEQSKIQELENDEDEASVDAKNLASEMEYRDSLKSEEKREENAAKNEEENEEASEPGCSVARSGKLDVAPDPTDVLTTVPQVVSIGKTKLRLNYEGRPDVPSLSIPLVEIKTPIETLVRTQRCFRLYHKTKPYVFCAADSRERDAWVTDIYKSVFCINSGRSLSKKALKKSERGEEVKLPARSTKIQRWMKQLQKKNEVEEIQIIGVANSPPKVTVNGDDVVIPAGSKGEANMNEGNQE